MLKKQTLTTKEAFQKIAKFCAYQERCHQEVRDKLFSYGLFKDDVEMIIYELTQQDFLNEERFALAFARGKFKYKKWGRTKIIMELKRRKVSDYCIKKGLAEIDEDLYLDVLNEVLSKKFDKTKGVKLYQRKYKAAQYAISRGFENALVWETLKSIG